MICLQKGYLKIILEKLTFNDFFDLIILNKLTICKNFYIMIKYIADTPVNSNDDLIDTSQLKVQMICEKSLESVLLNRKGFLKLDPISYFLMLIVYNL